MLVLVCGVGLCGRLVGLASLQVALQVLVPLLLRLQRQGRGFVVQRLGFVVANHRPHGHQVRL